MAEKNCKKFLLCVLIVTFFLLTPQYCLYLHHKLMVTQNLCWERAVPFLNITCSPGVSLASPICAIPLAWLVREPYTSGEHTAEKHEIAHSSHHPIVWQGGPSRAGSLVTSLRFNRAQKTYSWNWFFDRPVTCTGLMSTMKPPLYILSIRCGV